MTKQLADIQDRIRNGEDYLNTLKPDDPKRAAVIDKLGRLNSQLRELKQGATASKETLQPSDRTYDPVNVATSPHISPPHWKDPRPDMMDDSELWGALLELAYEYDHELCAVLNGFRCGGTRLRYGETRWVLRPDIDLSGCTAWPSQAEYDESREKYLKECGSVLGALLDELTRRFPRMGAQGKTQVVEQPEEQQAIQTVMQI